MSPGARVARFLFLMFLGIAVIVFAAGVLTYLDSRSDAGRRDARTACDIWRETIDQAKAKDPEDSSTFLRTLLTLAKGDAERAGAASAKYVPLADALRGFDPDNVNLEDTLRVNVACAQVS